MNIQSIPIFKDNYIWLIVGAKSAVAIDPGDAKPLQDFLHKHDLSLDAILITHYHSDHVGGILDLKEEYNPNIYAPKSEQVQGITQQVSGGDELLLSSINKTLSVLDIPGHTLGHVGYYMPGILFCGDTLFSAGCGRIFEGSPQQMFDSLQKLAALPDETLVYCTHEYTAKNLEFAKTIEPSNTAIENKLNAVLELRKNNTPSIPTTIGEEKKYNPFLRCYRPEIVLHLENYFGLKISSSVEAFKYLRQLKDNC
jgi:hydroxyacylglutathione hydrolase